MRKFIFFAAALLVLVGCNKNEQENKTNAPAEMVTITGGIDFKSQAGARKVVAKPGWENVEDGNQVEFIWEEGDEIAVMSIDPQGTVTEIKKFTVSSISEDGKMAEFTGEALSGGMAEYFAHYPYGFGEAHRAGDEAEWLKNQEYTGNFYPVGYGMGSNNEFVIGTFLPVLDLSFTGEAVLGKIEYYVALSAGSYETECSAAISMGESGLQLTNEPQHVTLSVSVLNSSDDGFKLKFYDTNNQLLMEKEISMMELAYGKIYSFPALEVKAIPQEVDWTKPLSLGKEAAEFIYIETGVDVSGYTEDANHKKLNEEGDLWEVLDGNELHIQTYTNKINSSLEGMFSGYVSVKLFKGLQYIHATTAEDMFMNCSTLNLFNYTDFNTEDVTDMSNMFNGCESLVAIEIPSFNTKKVTDMSGMFAACKKLVNIDLSSFNTENVTDMNSMFNGCAALEGLNLSDNFKVAGVKTNMFTNCGSEDGCTVYGVTNADIKTALKTDTGWDESHMHFDGE